MFEGIKQGRELINFENVWDSSDLIVMFISGIKNKMMENTFEVILEYGKDNIQKWETG